MDIWLTSGQVAQALGCSVGTVLNIPEERLPFQKPGTRRHYHLADVQAYYDQYQAREQARKNARRKK